VLVRFTKTLLLLAIATLLPVAVVRGQAPKKDWKDGGAEYKFYDAAVKQTDNTKKLDALNAWKAKYPTTDYNMERLGHYLLTYQALNQPERVLETGSEILAADPKNLPAVYLMTAAGTRLAKPTPQQLAIVEKAANSLTADLDSFKPAAASDADWAKNKPDLLSLGYMTLGWINMTRKENPAAEKNFVECLKVNPNNGQVSYWLGSVIIAQRNPDTYPINLAFWKGTLTEEEMEDEHPLELERLKEEAQRELSGKEEADTEPLAEVDEAVPAMERERDGHASA